MDLMEPSQRSYSHNSLSDICGCQVGGTSFCTSPARLLLGRPHHAVMRAAAAVDRYPRRKRAIYTGTDLYQ